MFYAPHTCNISNHFFKENFCFWASKVTVYVLNMYKILVTASLAVVVLLVLMLVLVLL
jgi:hypothetical protein